MNASIYIVLIVILFIALIAFRSFQDYRRPEEEQRIPSAYREPRHVGVKGNNQDNLKVGTCMALNGVRQSERNGYNLR